MRIVIDIQADESGAALLPASVTITFPPGPSAASTTGQKVTARTVELGTAAEDAGPAPITVTAGNEPVMYVATPSRASVDQIAPDDDDGKRGNDVLDAGPAPVLTTEIASSETVGTRMRTSGDGSILAASPEPARAEVDDLTVIDGIGPKISSVLAESGIATYEQLAASDSDTLAEILAAAKVRANPETWPGQAAVAARGDMAALESYQTDLKSR